ncbi:hypothetical protein D3C87_1557270 [compost metagenome]
MIQQRGDDFAAAGRQVINLEQLAAQNRIRLDGGDQCAHQAVNQFAGGRKLLDADALLGLLVKHDVVHLVFIMPDAEFCAHAVVFDLRAEHFRLGCRER